VPLAQAAIKAGGGRVLAAGQNITAIEGTPPKSRVAILQWESIEQYNAWRKSAAYVVQHFEQSRGAPVRTEVG
jgi:uncharacterized protein (DUF1330 family)